MPGPWSGRILHFVGMGGAGMSGLAVVARALGATVSGSDRAASPYLAATGLEPIIGHSAENVPAGAEVVYSSAISPDNPERRPPELHRADLLAEITALKPTIAVSGTHGKTTTSSMLVHALRGAGADPSYLVGGEVRSTGANAGWGTGEWLVVEADESDRSLLKLHPTIAVVTNAELDHHTTYSSRRDVDDTFRAFLALARQPVVWAPLAALAPGATTFDVEPELTAGGSRFTFDGTPVTLPVPGAHNARNAAAALTAVRLAGADVARAAAALASFEGAGRRFERLGTTASGALVVDDYAHHPTEVAATIAAARTLAPRRVVALFQPHLYSRTAREARRFGEALAAADLVVVLDVYAAREQAADHPGVTGKLVANAAADAGGRVAWLPRHELAEAFLRRELREGDLLLTLGAGDVDRVGKALV
jgi:UDP-N-acetylmuramate--alanine ligase